jgi:hypothetical protein
MTRFPHDQFAKDYLKELLTPLGEVESSRNIAGEVREIDVWFIPNSTPQINAQVLGILGQFAATPAIFEPFRMQSRLAKFAVVWASCLTFMLIWNVKLNEKILAAMKLNYPSYDSSPTASIALLDGFSGATR